MFTRDRPNGLQPLVEPADRRDISSPAIALPTRAFACGFVTAVLIAGALVASLGSGADNANGSRPRSTGPPLSFAPNGGRTSATARYIAQGAGYSIFLTRRGATLALQGKGGRTRLDVDLVGVKPRSIRGEHRLAGRVNAFRGGDSSRWARNLPTFSSVRYAGAWPGVDVRYHGRGRLLEYDFIVAPGADPRHIGVRLKGPDSVRVDDDGSLVASIGGRSVHQRPPVAWQTVGAERRSVDVSYAMRDGVVRLQTGRYDRSLPLTIDPVLSYATYLGGTGDDEARAVAVDSAGAVYIAGRTASSDFPKSGAVDSTQSSYEAFVTKLNAAGTSIVYSTYLGGASSDYAADVAVGSDGSAYVTGGTQSATGATGFPVAQQLRDCRGTQFTVDAWVARLAPAGNALTWSTCLNADAANATVGGGEGIAVDGSGNAYVTGTTSGNVQTVAGSFDTSANGNYDAFVTKINAAAPVTLAYSGFIGGTSTDFGHAIAVDPSGNAYVTGEAASSDLGTVGAAPLQPTSGGGYDGFVTKILAAGTSRSYQSYLGGSGGDAGHGIAVNSSGVAFVAGAATGDFPGIGSLGGIDGVLAKIPANGSATGYAAVALGGSSTDQAYDVALEGSNAYVTGKSFSSNFATSNAVRSKSSGSADVFVRKLNSSLATVYSTFLGVSTNNSQGDPDIVVNPTGTAHVVGTTTGSGFATAGALDSTVSAYEGFYARIAPSTASITDGPSGATQDSTPTFGYAGDTGSSFECKVDGASYTTCPGTTSGSTTLPTQPQGSHTFYLRQVDKGGTAGPAATRAFTVDTTAPAAPALDTPAAGASTAFKPLFSWASAADSMSGVGTYEVVVDGVKVGDVTGGCSPCSLEQPTELTEGAHRWRVAAVDRAGNRADSEERTFTVTVAPVPSFTIAPNPLLVGRSATFDASASSDHRGSITRYEWDLDGDGSFETDGGGSPATTRAYPSVGEVPITLRVTDAAGNSAATTQTLRVSSTGGTGTQIGVSINKGAQYTNDPNVKLKIVAPPLTSSILVSNDGGFDNPSQFMPVGEIAWKLDSSGPERLPKTVYVRFLTGSIAGSNFTDDIILDERPPTVSTAAIAGAPPAAARALAAAAKRYTIKVKARDSNSGVAGVQVTANKRKPGRLLRYRTRLKVKAKQRPKFLRAKDRAGNFSRWKKLK